MISWLKSGKDYLALKRWVGCVARISPADDGLYILTIRDEPPLKDVSVSLLKRYAREYLMAKEEGRGDEKSMDRHNRA